MDYGGDDTEVSFHGAVTGLRAAGSDERFDANAALTLLPLRRILEGRMEIVRLGRSHLRGLDDPDYAPVIQRFMASARDSSGPVTHAPDVAAALWRAATDPSAPLHIPAGADAEIWMAEAG